MQIRTQKEENINKMSSSMEEEALSNCVQQYKVLQYMTKVTKISKKGRKEKRMECCRRGVRIKRRC